MSYVFYAKILLFLVHIKGVKQGLQCNSVCEDSAKEALIYEQTGAKFKFNKQVDQCCEDDTKSWDVIEVRIFLARDVDNLSEFSFLSFVMKFLSEHVSSSQFLFGNQYEELESNSSVSCVLHSNVSRIRRVASNGLDALNSPLFCLRDNASNFQGTPFVGYVEMGGKFYFSAGFTYTTTLEYSVQFDQRNLTRVKIVSVLLLVIFTLFSPSILTLFCATIKTVQIECLSRPAKVEEPEGNPWSEPTEQDEIEVVVDPSRVNSDRNISSTNRDAGKEFLSPRVATEHGELNEVDVDHSRVNLHSDHNISSTAANHDAGKEFLSPRVGSEQGELNQALDHSGINDDLEHDSSTTALDRDAPVNSLLSKQECNKSIENSLEVDLPRGEEVTPHHMTTLKRTTSKFLSQTLSGGNKGHRVHGSSSAREENYSPIEPDADDNSVGKKQQTGVQHQNIKNGNLTSVQVMDVAARASPVGFRNVIANKVFSNSKSLSLPYQFVKFVILIMFPLFFPILIDVFVLAIPRSFPRIAANLPSPFLTKYVFIFTCKKYSGFMYACFVCYFFRIVCFCFLQSSSHWVPSFVDRKHFLCFLYNNYVSQLVFPNNSWSACNECKKAPEWEIPVNIKNNLGYIPLEIFSKNWKAVFKNLYPEYQQWLLQGNEEENICRTLRKWILLFLGKLGLFILFLALIALDTIASFPVISLCYGRVWFTVNWFKNRYIQAGCLIGEFFLICFSTIWIMYFSFCCSLSMAVALLSFCIAGLNYPVEILLYMAINMIVWHIFWSCYSSFTDIYDDLLLKLFNACRENHASEINQYKEGDVIYIPQKLFTSACDKLMPIANSVKKLFLLLIAWVVSLFLVFSFIMGSNTNIPASKVLMGTVTLLVFHPKLWDFLLSSGKKRERKDAVLLEKVKDFVDAFFKGKLD